jgi:hypothetical protein
MNLTITDQILEDGEYVTEKPSKNSIFLHHTAGSHDPRNVITGWNKDRNPKDKTKRLRIATAFVIGGLDKNGTDKDGMDGKIYRAFNEECFAWHLGVKNAANTTQLEKQSIGIELCNYGPLTKTTDGKFITYVKSEMHLSQVCDLGFQFRKFQLYQRYSDKQIASLKELLIFLGSKFKINLKLGLFPIIDLPNGGGLELNKDALAGNPGIWSHTSVRLDKYDIHPQAEITALLKSL